MYRNLCGFHGFVMNVNRDAKREHFFVNWINIGHVTVTFIELKWQDLEALLRQRRGVAGYRMI